MKQNYIPVLTASAQRDESYGLLYYAGYWVEKA